MDSDIEIDFDPTFSTPPPTKPTKKKAGPRNPRGRQVRLPKMDKKSVATGGGDKDKSPLKEKERSRSPVPRSSPTVKAEKSKNFFVSRLGARNSAAAASNLKPPKVTPSRNSGAITAAAPVPATIGSIARTVVAGASTDKEEKTVKKIVNSPPIVKKRVSVPTPDASSDEEEVRAVGNKSTRDAQLSSNIANMATELQKKLSLKKKKLEEHFSAIKHAPPELLDIIRGQDKERKDVLQSFRQSASEIRAKLDSVVQTQTLTEDKLTKMLSVLQKHFSMTKESLSNTASNLQSMVNAFEKGIADLDQKHDESSQLQLKAINKEIALIQKRLLQDDQ